MQLGSVVDAVDGHNICHGSGEKREKGRKIEMLARGRTGCEPGMASLGSTGSLGHSGLGLCVMFTLAYQGYRWLTSVPDLTLFLVGTEGSGVRGLVAWLGSEGVSDKPSRWARTGSSEGTESTYTVGVERTTFRTAPRWRAHLPSYRVICFSAGEGTDNLSLCRSALRSADMVVVVYRSSDLVLLGGGQSGQSGLKGRRGGGSEVSGRRAVRSPVDSPLATVLRPVLLEDPEHLLPLVLVRRAESSGLYSSDRIGVSLELPAVAGRGLGVGRHRMTDRDLLERCGGVLRSSQGGPLDDSSGELGDAGRPVLSVEVSELTETQILPWLVALFRMHLQNLECDPKPAQLDPTEP